MFKGKKKKKDKREREKKNRRKIVDLPLLFQIGKSWAAFGILYDCGKK